LGCTLYFLLTGRPPFPGGTFVEKVRRHQNEEPVPVERLRPDVPPDLAVVVRKLMAKRPGDRFASPAELIAALDRPVPARESVELTFPTASRPPVARRRRIWLLPGVAAVVAAGLAVWHLSRPRARPVQTA